jgi:hypothetical protein
MVNASSSTDTTFFASEINLIAFSGRVHTFQPATQGTKSPRKKNRML